jgi:hypothetical protein
MAVVRDAIQNSITVFEYNAQWNSCLPRNYAVDTDDDVPE